MTKLQDRVLAPWGPSSISAVAELVEITYSCFLSSEEELLGVVMSYGRSVGTWKILTNFLHSEVVAYGPTSTILRAYH